MILTNSPPSVHTKLKPKGKIFWGNNIGVTYVTFG